MAANTALLRPQECVGIIILSLERDPVYCEIPIGDKRFAGLLCSLPCWEGLVLCILKYYEVGWLLERTPGHFGYDLDMAVWIWLFWRIRRPIGA